jgi:hypothetical protein
MSRAAARLLTLALLLVASGCAREGSARPAPLRTLAAGLNPTVAVDERDGAAYTVWIGTGTTGESDVFLARLHDPAEPVRVNHLPGDAAPHDQAPPQVAVGPDGSVYVVWQTTFPVEGRRFPASNLQLARSTDGGRTFAEPVFVNDDANGPPTSHSFHDVVVAPDGTILVSWIDGRERDAARTGRAPAPAASGDGHAGHGSHSAAGEEDPLPGPEIRIARSRDGGASFEPSVVVDRSACPCCRTALAVGGDGAVYIAWRREAEGDVRDVVIARADPGSLRFSPAVPLHEDGWVFPACPHAGPSLAVAADGVVHAAWYTGREGRQGLWYARSLDQARSFSPPAPIVTGEWVPPSLARVAVTGESVTIAWEDRREEDHRIRISEVRAGEPRPTRFRADGSLPSLVGTDSGWRMVWAADGAVRTTHQMRRGATGR